MALLQVKILSNFISLKGNIAYFVSINEYIGTNFYIYPVL